MLNGWLQTKNAITYLIKAGSVIRVQPYWDRTLRSKNAMHAIVHIRRSSDIVWSLTVIQNELITIMTLIENILTNWTFLESALTNKIKQQYNVRSMLEYFFFTNGKHWKKLDWEITNWRKLKKNQTRYFKRIYSLAS